MSKNWFVRFKHQRINNNKSYMNFFSITTPALRDMEYTYLLVQLLSPKLFTLMIKA